MDEDELRKIAAADQSLAGTKDFALMVATFYNTLYEQRVESAMALQLTMIWIQGLLQRMNNGSS